MPLDGRALHPTGVQLTARNWPMLTGGLPAGELQLQLQLQLTATAIASRLGALLFAWKSNVPVGTGAAQHTSRRLKLWQVLHAARCPLQPLPNISSFGQNVWEGRHRVRERPLSPNTHNWGRPSGQFAIQFSS